jgi:hypothetical protein
MEYRQGDLKAMMIEVQGKFDSQCVTILIDSWATHYFMTPIVALK